MKENVDKIHVIEAGFFKLDGGAMFGIIPKSMWQKLNPPDEDNLCTWAMRCLLVETDNRRILIDTGMGDKQDAKFRSHFHPHGADSLLGSLARKGFLPEDITDVFLTHLHFDHVGGAVRRNESGNLVPTFPNATYWSNERHWRSALAPNAREAASFLKENFVPLQTAGVLKMVERKQNLPFAKGMKIRFSDGHTDAMMLVEMQFEGRSVLFCADNLPSSFHIGLPYVMSYDIRPLVSLTEKQKIVETAVRKNQLLFLEHDPKNAFATVKKSESGRIVLDKVGQLEDFF